MKRKLRLTFQSSRKIFHTFKNHVEINTSPIATGDMRTVYNMNPIFFQLILITQMFDDGLL
jgi:hypothetical protein